MVLPNWQFVILSTNLLLGFFSFYFCLISKRTKENVVWFSIYIYIHLFSHNQFVASLLLLILFIFIISLFIDAFFIFVSKVVGIIQLFICTNTCSSRQPIHCSSSLSLRPRQLFIWFFIQFLLILHYIRSFCLWLYLHLTPFNFIKHDPIVL